MICVNKTCANCGNIFSVKPSLVDRVNNCSKLCGYESKKKKHLIHAKCGGCQKEFSFTKSSKRINDVYFCSNKCSTKTNGNGRTSDWKIGKDGYVYKSVKGKKVLQHRVVFEIFLGRKLFAHENVHHINGFKSDNRIENLELWSTHQPKGQRIGDKLKAAIKLLKDHGYVVHEPFNGLVDGLLSGAETHFLN